MRKIWIEHLGRISEVKKNLSKGKIRRRTDEWPDGKKGRLNTKAKNKNKKKIDKQCRSIVLYISDFI